VDALAGLRAVLVDPEHPERTLALDEVFRLLLASAPDVITVLDVSGRMIFLNRTSPDRVLADVLGTPAADYLPPPHGARYQAAVDQVVATGQGQTVEVLTVSGAWFETRLVPIERGGQVVAVMGIGSDVSARKRFEQELRHAQKMEAIGQLTAGIAHNFNNILMGILPNIQLSMAEASETQRRRLRDAEAAAWRAAELIRQLMLFARRRPESAHRPLDLVEVVRGITDLCSEAFGRVAIAVDIDGDPGTVLGDHAQLGQVFLNVLVNARDACEAGAAGEGRIRVHISSLPAGAAELAEHGRLRACEVVRVSITDNGVGMDEAVRQRVFEPFFTTKEPGQGTGLGLASAYAIVEEHHGWIGCASATGAGTSFTIYLPVSTGAVEVDQAEPGGHLPGGSEVILVIDDDELVRQSVADALGWKGYTVLIGRDLHDGSSILRRLAGETHLVIADVSTRSRWTASTLEALLADAGGARVVLLHSQPEPPPGCEGAHAVLRKPVGVEELLRTVRRVLDE